MSPFPEKVFILIQSLIENFWDEWCEESQNFPDTEDGVQLSFIYLRSSIISIILNFILSFEVPDRIIHLECMINELRKLEISFRDR